MANRSQMGTDLMLRPVIRVTRKSVAVSLLFTGTYSVIIGTLLPLLTDRSAPYFGLHLSLRNRRSSGLIDLAFDDTLIIFMDAPVF